MTRQGPRDDGHLRASDERRDADRAGYTSESLMTKWIALSRQQAGSVLAAALVLVASGAWLLARWPPSPMAQTGNLESKLPNDEFEQRVRKYLLENPEVIAEAMQRLEERQRVAEASEAKALLANRAEDVFRDPASPVGGNPQGDVTLVEFFDYNCSFCRQMAPRVTKAEQDDPKLRIVYKDISILGPNSSLAAKAALAADRQGKYVAFHKALMQAKDSHHETSILEAAGRVGLDLEQLKRDIRDPAIQGALDRNLTLAQALRIDGTPAFVIGEQIARGAVDLATMQEMIRVAREKK